MNARERAHLGAVAAMGCVICGAPTEIHHLRHNPVTGLHLGMGQRAPHWCVIPLCAAHHRTGGPGVAYHAGPREWEAIHGTEIELWKRVEARLREAA